ncbi:hypothetical protein FRC04_003751 [Tulasnella sp. 424]|nr:hypothetical protein FRC04_003751 [Tulasnella sp. 424]KAG8977083.1 hypothetical protein FRC05_002604 [Tulasnella sp. 425]
MADDGVKKEQHLPPKDFADEAYGEGSEPLVTPTRSSGTASTSSNTQVEGGTAPSPSPDATSAAPKRRAQSQDIPFKHIPLSETQSKEVLSQPAEDILSEDIAPRSAPLARARASASNDITPEQLKAYLLEKARQFLHSPEIRWQDTEKKREFLLEKGLDRREIKMLLEEVAPPPPPLPPRNYPGAKESRTMYLLKWFAKFTKVCAYVAGTSAAAIFVYWWLLLPRISSSLAARGELQAQRLAQAEKLKERVDDVARSREVGAGTAAEDEITVVDDSAESTGEPRTSHPTDESFKDLTRALTDLRTSLTTLRFARQVDNSRQETLDTVNNLTGYVSARVYSVPGYTANGGIVKKPPVLGPIEDEVKSEIRALKGLALNRRSFVATALRSNSQQSVPAA